jgi:hypothetical protein
MYEADRMSAQTLIAAFVRIVTVTVILTLLLGGSTVVLSVLSPSSLGFAFHAQLVDQGASPTLAPGGTAAYTMHFRNVGLVPWQRGTDKQVNLGISGDTRTWADAGIADGWMSATRVTTTTESVVLPGTIGTFTFNVRAPGTPGTYRVPMRLVVEGLTWIDDVQAVVAVTSDLGFHSHLLDQSLHPTLNPGELSLPLTVRFRNTGAKTWMRGVPGQQANLGVVGDDKSLLSLAVGWPAADRVAFQAEPSVGPGGVATFTFRVRASTTSGTYPLHLRPVVDGLMWMEDDQVITFVTVLPASGATSQSVVDAALKSASAPAFTLSATVDPVTIATGGTAKITATFASSVATTAIVGVEVYSPDGTTLAYQRWSDEQSFAAGEPRVFLWTWQVPASATPGTYKVGLRSYGPAWKSMYGSKDSAASFRVAVPAATVPAPGPQGMPAVSSAAPPQPSSGGATPAPTPPATPGATSTPAATAPPVPSPRFATNASAAPPSVTPGGTVNLTALVTSATATDALVDIEVTAPDGVTTVYQVWFDNQTFAAGEQRTYPAVWRVPTTAAIGTYALKVGVFAPAWAVLYSWSSPATILVTAPAPSPSPTPAASVSPTPVPTATATPVRTATPTPTPPPTTPPPTTPPPTTSINDPSFLYGGTWSTSTGTGKYLSDDHFSAVTGSTYSITFVGTSLRLYSALASHHGIGAVSLDGGPESDVDFYAATRQEQALVYSTPTLSSATHTVTMRVTGRHNAASTGFVVTADRADLVGTLVVPTPTPTPAPTVTPAPTPTPAPPPPPPGGLSPLHVQGNALVNAAGQPTQLHGVNRAGTDFACIQGWGFIDGPSDAASLASIRSWRTNAVRVPMNEDCWLAINGSPAAYSGVNYQNFIGNWVNLINQNGMYAILELHWSAPGSQLATGQQPMLDMDHSVTFWSQVAATFKGNGAVIFEPQNEPYPDNNQDTAAAWKCWRDGGTCPGVGYQAAGMQTIVNAIRATGATNVIALGGVQYSNALSQWLTYKPTDSLNNLAAVWHVYNFNTCNTVTCFNNTVAPVAAQVPLIATEIGVDNCDAAFLNTVMTFLDAKQQSYLAWVWATWGTACSSIALVSDYQGTPTTYGQIYKTHLASLP